MDRSECPDPESSRQVIGDSLCGRVVDGVELLVRVIRLRICQFEDVRETFKELCVSDRRLLLHR
jgi:hypothetical protein